MKKFLLTTIAAMILIPSLASARVFVGVGPVYRPFGYYGWGYGPYWGPAWGGYYGPTYRAPSTGSVKFDTHEKNANVYVNDAFAGTVGQVKTLHLRPGSYNIQVSEPGRTGFEQKVYVTAGATVKVHPSLQPVTPPAPAGF